MKKSKRDVRRKKTFDEEGVSVEEVQWDNHREDNHLSGSGRTDALQPSPLRIHFIIRIILGALMAALGAVMLTLAFPPYDVWPLIFVGFVPILLSLHRIMPRRVSGLALGIGVGGFFWGYLYGMFEGTNVYYLEFIPYGIGLLAMLLGSRERQFHARTNYRFFIIQGAVIWVGIEFIRGIIPFVGTWGFASYSLYSQFWFIQPVSFFSTYGLSFLILIINYALGLNLIAYFDARWQIGEELVRVSEKGARRWMIAVFMLLICWTGYSLTLLDTPPAAVRVAAIQPGLFRHEIEVDGESKVIERKNIEFQEDLEQLLEQTREAAKKGARFIVWPEGILPIDPQKQGAAVFREFASEVDAFLAIGYSVKEDSRIRNDEYGHPLPGSTINRTDNINERTQIKLRNEVTLLSPDGVFLGVYSKDHPVTFSGETNTNRGIYPVYQTLIGNLSTIISFDLNFTDTTRKITRNGARLIAVPSNDWPAIAFRHYSHLVFRAVENRVTMIKADAHYNSAIIDPYGRINRKVVSQEPKQATLIYDVPLGTGDTFVVTWGDWMGWVCLVGMVFFIFLDITTWLNTKRREKNENRAFSVVS